MINSVLRFFDLYSRNRGIGNVAQGASDDEIAGWRQFVVYIACAIGIILGPYALDAATGKYVDFLTMFGSPVRLFWAVVFGFVLTASLFKTVLNATTPLVIQIGSAIVAGFGSGKAVPKAIEVLSKWFTGA
jgi:hypothetical protein